MSRIIGISDIHGEYYVLCSVLDKIAPQKDDTLSFLWVIILTEVQNPAKLLTKL